MIVRDEPVAATAIKLLQRDHIKRHALDHFLHRLKQFVRAYPRAQGDDMPEHSIEWITTIGSSPGAVVADAMKELPALWLDALPDGLVIVPRAQLEKYLGTMTTEFLSGVGANEVMNQGARLQQERIEKVAVMDVKTHHGLRDVEITCATGDECITVERMFDGKGSETFDPTDAVEVDGDGSFHRLEAGDVLTIRVRVEE